MINATTGLDEQRTTMPRIDPCGARVLHYLFFPGGGIGRYAHELLMALHDVPGLEVELACPPNFEWRSHALYTTWPQLLQLGGGPSVLRRARFLKAQVVNPLRAVERARAAGFDLVHFSNINHLTRPLWSRRLAKSPLRVAATAHDVRRAKSMVHRGYENRQLAGFYRRADALFVHSRHQKEDLVDFSGCEPHRVHLVPHGPYDYGLPTATREELRERMDLPADRQIALAFGQIRDEKNLDLLLRALAHHRGKLHVVVAGRSAGGSHRPVEAYRRLVADLSLEDSVTFFDEYVSDERVPDYFELADWVAVSYSASFTSQSGVLNVAANYRRPVLLSDTPTFRETVEECDIGVLVDPDDVEALVAGIGRIVDRCDRDGGFAFEAYLERFGWRENARRTAEVYRSLLSGGESAR